MIETILAIVSGLVTLAAWYVTNRAKSNKEIERDKILKEKEQVDKDLDNWERS